MRLATVIATTALGVILALPLGAETVFVRYAVEGGAVYLEVSDPQTGPDTPFAVASVGKAFTAVAVLRQVERGALRLDDAAADVLPPDVAGWLGGLKGVTVRHLLTMTSGLPDYYTDDWLEDALADQDRVQRPEAALRDLAEDPEPLFPPGSDFDYSNTNYVLLGLILETLAGRSYAEVMQAEVFGPAGMTDSFVFGTRPLPTDFARGHAARALVRHYYAGEGFGDGGVVASARDVARFYRALFAERTLLTDPMIAEMLRDAAGAAYGMGVEVDDGLVGHSGGDLGYSADVAMDLRRGHVAVILVAREDADTDWAWDRLTER